MLTKQDLTSIGNLIDTKTTKIVQSETRKIVQEETKKIVREEVTDLKKDIKILQKDVSKIQKDINTVISHFDNEYVELRQRVNKIEKHVGIAP